MCFSLNCQIIPLQTTPAVVWGALPLGCPGSPVESWPSSSWELRFYTPAGRLSPPWCMRRNQGSRGLWCENKRRKRNNYSLWFKAVREMDTPPLASPPQYILIMEQDSPLITCSGEMVFLSDLLHISLASEDMRCINSVQQLTTSSLASFATRTLGSVSLIILLIAALGMVRSSSFPEEEAIVAGKWSQTKANQSAVLDWAVKSVFRRWQVFLSYYPAQNNVDQLKCHQAQRRFLSWKR